MEKASQYDIMTKTKVSSLVIKLGIPTTLSMLVTNIYNLADTAFVGKLGTSASGAVGVSFGFMAIIQAFGFMYGQGAGSVIARLLGEKDRENASGYASTAFFISMLTGILLAVGSAIFLKPLIYFLGSSDTIYPYASEYLKYILFATPFTMGSFALNNILRFQGKASLAMIGLMAGAILNIVGDPILMFTFNMGIRGAGLATALSQILSFFILLSIFLLKKSETVISAKKVTFNPKILGNIIGTGLPSLIRQGFASISTILLNSNAVIFGDAAVAAMSIVNRITMFVFCLGLGLGQGFQPVCGFNFGAKKYTRVIKAYKFTIWCSEIMIAVCALIVFLLSDYLIGLFRNDPEVIKIGTFALKAQSISLLVQPLCVATNMSLQSTGKKTQAAITALLRNGLCFIPMILVLPRFFGLLGVQITQSIADIVSFIIIIPISVKFLQDLRKKSEVG